MLSESLAALAGAAATGLVGAMVTDVWQLTKQEVADLFGRGENAGREGIAAALDVDAQVLARADDGEADEIRAELEDVWRRRLEHLLEKHPEMEPELGELVEQIKERAPADGSTWVQHNVARDHATQFAVQGGNVVYHQAPEPPKAGNGRP
ncbi:hypothetical protein [Nocardiopsis aegyptia]|uniref:Uncharacterized protein n=1 Tax=Nocardiopsis aegyptia TaxID=220378 RepID=A0A7Z0JD00_9ACTN|nr:hypothetical protein [Nocardiopsis aegyptia]NYJ37983.1 hypothetical protein [Nocardiopsis aegyptia]